MKYLMILIILHAQLSFAQSLNYENKESSKIEILFQIKNDFNLPPMGLLAILEDKRAITKASNDLGYTHGVELEASMIEVSKHSESQWKIIAISDLFEMPADPNKSYNSPKGDHLNVHFTERDVFAIQRLLKDLDTGMFVQGSLGISILNSNSMTIGSSGQQEAFHQFNSQFNPNQGTYVYVDDNQGVRVSGFVSFALGMADAVIKTGDFTLKASLSESTQLKTSQEIITEALYADVSVEHSIKKSKLKFKIAAQAVFHNLGTEFTPSAKFTFERKKWAIDSIIYFPMGSLQNEVLYNKDPEPYTALGFHYYFTRK